MDLGELVTKFRERADDTAGPPYRWSDPEVYGYLNEAEREASIRAKLIRDQSTASICEITVTSASKVYPKSDKIIAIESAYLTDAYGVNYILYRTDWDWVRDNHPNWPTYTPGIPTILVEDDKVVTLINPPDRDFTLTLDVYRLPVGDMEVTVDEPEIALMHQDGLVDWAEHRAYLKRDPDTYDPAKSDRALSTFVRRFGIREDANVMRKHRQRRPNVIRPIDC